MFFDSFQIFDKLVYSLKKSSLFPRNRSNVLLQNIEIDSDEARLLKKNSFGEKFKTYICQKILQFEFLKNFRTKLDPNTHYCSSPV